MARSQYLFQGPNTKNLPSPERQKLAYLLKSFDENSPITVNKKNSQVIFPSGEVRPPKNLSDQFRPAVAPSPEQKNINAMQFSYRQTLPYEKTIAPPAPVKALPQNFPASPSNFQPKSAASQNLPKNVVDLKNINQ